MNTRPAMEFQPEQISRQACFIIVFLLSLPLVVFTASASPEELLRFFPDDAFYYLQTASNFAAHGTISFDGINETNGFHPLYFIVASTLARMFGKSSLLQITFAFHGFCIFLSACLIVRSIRPLPFWLSAALLTFLCVPLIWLYIWLSSGMESGLVLLSTVLLFVEIKKCAESEFSCPLHSAGLGVVLSMLLLSRLDMIICVTPLVGYIGLRLMRVLFKSPFSFRKIFPFLLILGIPFFLCILYITFNLRIFGHIIPVSAVSKSVFFVPFSGSWNASTSGGNPMIVFILVLPFLLSLILLGRFLLDLFSHHRQALNLNIVLLSAGVALFYLYLRFFASNFFRWYFTFPLAFTAIALADMLHDPSLRISTFRLTRVLGYSFITATVAAGIIFNTVFFFGWNRPKSIQQHLYRVAIEIDTRLGRDAVVGTFDAGVLGFFSGRRVINLDGLANSYDYLFNYLVPKHVYDYFEKQGVSHFLVRDALIKNLPEVKSGNYAEAQFVHDSRVLLRKEDEVFRYDIPGGFLLICYRVSSTLSNFPRDPAQ